MTRESSDHHETALLAQLRQTALAEPGALLPVHDYMSACITRYYCGGSVLGRAGDFVTAPEISQVFGELIGLWCAIVWQQIGRPSAFNLVELGPGRGTMMRDALRALRIVPDCLAAARVQLIETSMALRDEQAATLANVMASGDIALHWPTSFAGVADLPTIVLGNEFVDALPVHQAVRAGGQWHTRCITLGPDGGLAFAAGAVIGDDAADALHGRMLAHFGPQARDGDILEFRPLGSDLAGLNRFAPQGLAVLLIDYGHVQSGLGDTLQAVRQHRFEPPLSAPGEADLTTQVDFCVLGHQLTGRGLAVTRPVTQGEFLSALGISERASRLMGANPAQANAIEMAVARLLSPSGMGARFQVLGARSPHLPPLPGLSG